MKAATADPARIPPAAARGYVNHQRLRMAAPNVRSGLQALWDASNPEANLAQRKEQAGWIVQEANGTLRIEPFALVGTSFGCAEFDIALPSSGTVVGWVHTHPYAVGDGIANCDWQVVTYGGEPSDVDREAGKQLGAALGLPGALPGYIIDKDGTYAYSGDYNTATPRGPRCY